MVQHPLALSHRFFSQRVHFRLIHRLLAFMLLLVIFALHAQAADPVNASTTNAVQSASTPTTSADQRFLAGRACLLHNDAPCAQVVLAGINPASPYAKILEAQLAILHGDNDTALRLLIPLQNEAGLLPQAYASVHATLAQAYASQDNVLRTVEQYTLAEPFLDGPDEIAASQKQLWKLLSDKPRELLVEMRGESPNPIVQGWVDLALAYLDTNQRTRAIAQWRATYPDHPAGEALLRTISSALTPVVNTVQITGKIALLLPLDTPSYAAAAQAILAGFKTAHAVSGSSANILVYTTNGTPEGALATYQSALRDGAQFVVGPLVRNEMEALATSTLVTVPTLALNQPETSIKLPEHLLAYSMAVETEARQVAQATRRAGLQTVDIIIANTQLAKRMVNAFIEEWKAQDGGTLHQINFPSDDKLTGLKAEMAKQPPDCIFLAMDATDAHRVRPYIDAAIPTFGISHIYDGNPTGAQPPEAQKTDPQAQEGESKGLTAIHFVDMPWLLDPNNNEYTAYRANAAEFGKGWPQRWFALGADAYRLLAFISGTQPKNEILLHGLSGNIRLGEDGRFTRDLVMGQFHSDGIVLDDIAP